MIFLELVLQNFGPYYGRQVINLRPEVYPQTRPIILVGGMNGGGKTTFMDAFRLALYGHRAQCSTRGNLSYSDFLSQCIHYNTPSTESTRVELLLEHIVGGERVELRIVRTWNATDSKDQLGILKDDWPDKGLATTWDEYIENILPLGISNLFLFDGEQVKELAELETPPPAVIEAIQSLLGLELAERLAGDLEVLLNRKRKALANTQELATLEAIEKKLNELQGKLDWIRQNQETLQHNLERASQRRKEAMEKFTLEGGRFAAERSQLQREIQQLQKSTEDARERLRSLAAGSLPLGLITPLLKQAQIQGEKELKQQQAVIASKVIQARDERLLEYITQEKMESVVDKIREFLTLENHALAEEIATGEKPWLGVEEDTLNGLRGVLDYELPNQQQQVADQLALLVHLQTEMEATERQLATAASPEDFTQLKEQLEYANKALSEAQVAYELGNKQREQVEGAIAQTKKELQSYSEDIIQHRNDEHILTSGARVQQTLKLFKERLTLKKLNKLEVEVTECFRYLLHKGDLVHRISVDNTYFTLSLFDPQGQAVPKHRLSAGEKQLLAIAFLWGLARVSGRGLPVAIDTPLGRLDSSHRNNLVERYFPSASHQVILLSTDTEIAQKEVAQLREQDAIAQEYLLEYHSQQRQTTIKTGYFV